ncbi:hypothetical protein MRB53_006392 [Persea americana]|uniref:Uncharacterized protein n=1 Tax=Persea americana TaxID=3435 RepID=A0ACC2MG94_PERAE|nr:hypothetical protein MRB53_006392 [Persea americana]
MMDCRSTEIGRPLVLLICGTLVYYHCAYRNSSLLSLVSDVFIVLLCSLAILGLLFRQMNISVPVDPLEWQISQDTANGFVACLANTIGAAESVLRVAATGHDKRLFLKVVIILYLLSALGRLASGATVAYAGLCLFCLYHVVRRRGLEADVQGTNLMGSQGRSPYLRCSVHSSLNRVIKLVGAFRQFTHLTCSACHSCLLLRSIRLAFQFVVHPGK